MTLKDNHFPVLSELTWVFTANFLERFAYYAFRAVIVLIMVGEGIEGLGIPQDEALLLYAEFTAYTYLALLIGAISGDLIFGAFRSSLIGLAIMSLGFIYLNFATDQTIKLTLVIIAIGAGLVKPNFQSLIAFQFNNRQGKYVSLFMAQYFLVNLGAMLSGLAVGLLSLYFSYYSGFYIALLSTGLAFFCLYLTKKRLSNDSFSAHINQVRDNSKPLLIVPLMLAVCSISFIFWLLFELTHFPIYQSYPQKMENLGSVINGIIVFIMTVFCAFLFWNITFRTWLKPLLGVITFALGLTVFSTFEHSGFEISYLIVVLMIMHSIAEVLIGPVLFAIVAKYAPRKFMSTFFTLLILAGYLSSLLLAPLSSITFDNQHIALFCVLLALLLFLLFKQIIPRLEHTKSELKI